MKKAPVPDFEKQRIKTLNDYEILDTLPEQEFDDLTIIASTICDTPIALISLVDQERQWFKSKVGLDAEETHRDLAFCAHAILEQEVFEIEDATKDDRFHDNPLVTSDPDIRFYAGAQLTTKSGMPLGTLCVIDRKPKKLSHSQIEGLQALARQVMSQFELRRKMIQLDETRNRLYQANIELRQLTMQRTQFINHVSHEIRTPLNAILGFSRMLNEKLPYKNKAKEDEPSYWINLIKLSAENLKEMINHVLDLSRLEAGKLDLRESNEALHPMIEEVVQINRSQAQEKNIELSFQVDHSLPEYIRIDRTKFVQVLMNLVGNAVKFTPEGKKVSVDVKKSHKKFEVAVIDEGVGIKKENLKKIFSPFEQIQNSQSQFYVGSGLGLTISRELVEFMDGTIDVESIENVGSKFRVLLPLKKGKHEEEEQKLTIENYDLSEKTIVIVEDNAVNQLVIKAMLKKFNVNVVLASNGWEGVELTRLHEPDLVLVDLRLPDIDGFTVISEIRSNKVIKNIPLVILSADITQDSFKKADAYNIKHFLEKPVEEEKLVNVLIEYLT